MNLILRPAKCSLKPCYTPCQTLWTLWQLWLKWYICLMTQTCIKSFFFLLSFPITSHTGKGLCQYIQIRYILFLKSQLFYSSCRTQKRIGILLALSWEGYFHMLQTTGLLDISLKLKALGFFYISFVTLWNACVLPIVQKICYVLIICSNLHDINVMNRHDIFGSVEVIEIPHDQIVTQSLRTDVA